MSAKTWSKTYIKQLECQHVWKLDNVSVLGTLDTLNPLNSSRFCAIGQRKKREWQLQISLYGKNVWVYVQMHPTLHDRRKGNVWLSVTGENGFKIHVTESHEHIFGESDSWGCNVGERNSIFLNNRITLECKINYHEVLHNDNGTGDFPELGAGDEMKEPGDQLSDYFINLYIDQKLTDVVLRVANREFKSHKIVLTARSSVFGAMFEHDTRERAENVVEIKDLEPDVVDHMLRYMYTGKVEIQVLEEMASDLLIAADRYRLDKLKTMAERHLLGLNISTDDAVKLLVFADLHSAENLKHRVTQFIVDNLEECRQMESWNSTIKSDPRLMALILDKVGT